MNVIIDETLLEDAMRTLKERTYSATINRALESVVRQERIDRWYESMRGTDPWLPGYVEEVLDDEALALYRMPPEEIRKQLRRAPMPPADMIGDVPVRPSKPAKGRKRGPR